MENICDGFAAGYIGYICSWMGLRRGSDQIVAEKSVITQPGYDCYIAMGFRWPIEIDGLPNLNMGGFSMAMLNNQMVYIYIHIYIYIQYNDPAIIIFCGYRVLSSQ